jgi:DNA-directed RNA polymerase subunit RPC12/RpoP
MILLKSCPRCHGDMLQEELLGEVEIACLQCGHRIYPKAKTRQHPAAPVSVAKKAA